MMKLQLTTFESFIKWYHSSTHSNWCRFNWVIFCLNFTYLSFETCLSQKTKGREIHLKIVKVFLFPLLSFFRWIVSVFWLLFVACDAVFCNMVYGLDSRVYISFPIYSRFFFNNWKKPVPRECIVYWTLRNGISITSSLTWDCWSGMVCLLWWSCISRSSSRDMRKFFIY